MDTFGVLKGKGIEDMLSAFVVSLIALYQSGFLIETEKELL